MLGFLKKLLPSKKDKDVKDLLPIADEVNASYAQLHSLSDDQLRAKTDSFRAILKESTKEIETELEQMREQVAAEKDVDLKEEMYAKIDELDKSLNDALEDAMADLMVDAFAVVKETARRLTENKELRVIANDYDRELSATRPHIIIDGDKAIYKNKWNAAGADIEWNMIHYDVQLMGGAVLHQGKIAEMQTGEGKTLVATLPVYLNALSGQGVHLVTVNNYLARRDAEWNAPLFQFHGLTVDCIDLHQPNSEERRKAYRADIVYGTNNEFGFDYLRDNMTTHPEYLVQRKHFYTIIDEVDSVLVDEARTPLIISGPTDRNQDRQELYDLYKGRISGLVKEQRKLVEGYLKEAKQAFDKGKKDDAGVALFRAHRGLPKFNPLVSYLSEPGNMTSMHKAEAYFMQNNSEKMHEADDPLYFTIDARNNQVEMTDKGREFITRAGEDVNLFVLPDVAGIFSDIERDDSLTQEEKVMKKDALGKDYADKSENLHAIQQLLKAYTLFEKEIEYILEDNKVMIVDEQTGRVLAGRRYSDGLHQAIEAKENVKIEAATQTYATVTLQNYFRMYHKLAGMTGTAETEEAELFEIYKLEVIVVPTNRPIARDDRDDLVFKTKGEKYGAVIREIENMSEAGRPVLVGTTSVESSEYLGRLLKQAGVPHEVLNAKQHQREAEIVAVAGQTNEDGHGNVTVATNMAGRGTDIKLGASVKENGGLAIIGTERHESRRIDRQLRGRAGRQGDPGSSQFYVSLEDDLMRMFNAERVAKIMDRLGHKEGDVIQHGMITKSIGNAQKKVEENNFAMRKRLLEYDDVMNMQREVVYARRRNALYGDRIKVDLDNMLYDLCKALTKKHIDFTDAQGLSMDCIRLMSTDPGITADELNDQSIEQIADRIYAAAKKFYGEKTGALARQLLGGITNIKEQNPKVERVLIPFTDGHVEVQIVVGVKDALDTEGQAAVDELEKVITLKIIDENWKRHLREMDDLRQAVQNAVFEQKDPLLVYKQEAFDIFQFMLNKVNEEVLSAIFKADIKMEQSQTGAESTPNRDDFSKLRTRHDEIERQQRKQKDEERRIMAAASGGEAQDNRPVSRQQRRAQERKAGKKSTFPRR
ncbi:MAG: preprotein translocase subunit SecA [Bacteroidia bacterium]